MDTATPILNLKPDTAELLAVFDLNRNLGCALLAELTDISLPIPADIASRLEEHRQELAYEGDFWNEEELKMQFLAFLFRYAQLNEPLKIKMFYERSLQAVIGQYKLSVKCDCLLAKPRGIGNPQTPYFFLQEFKKQKQSEDAEGQMLAAMLIARHTNANQKPVYGAFLQGKNWTFTTLHEREYCVSQQFDASQSDDLSRIFQTLRNLKRVILVNLAN